jgi:phage major head subunit gpT-like protein
MDRKEGGRMKKKRAARLVKRRSLARTALAERPGRRSGEILRRSCAIDTRSVNVEDRTAEVSFSSENDAIISRWTGAREVLLHEVSAVDLRPLKETGAVLLNHDPGQILGKAENIRIDTKERKGKARIIFDDDVSSETAFRKVASGSLKGASVGFVVSRWQVLKSDESWISPEGRRFEGPSEIATKWRVLEFSLTPIPLDSSVGIGRNQNLEVQMVRKKKSPVVESGDDQEDLEDLQEEAETPHDAAELERQRSAEILELCSIYEETAPLAAELIRGGKSVSQARKAVMEELKRLHPPLPPSNSNRLEVGSTPEERFREEAELGLRLRSGQVLTPEEKKRASGIKIHTSLVELAAACARNARIPTAGLLKPELITRAMQHSTSDYPKILENVAHKSLIAGWTEAPATWRQLARVATATDFKAMSRPKLGDSGDLLLTPELTPMPETTVPETGESYAIATFSRRYGISRQAIINDDLSAFDSIPRLMGAAAARVVQKLFYDLLISASGVGPTMAEDSLPLFSATHVSGANYTAATGAPDVAGLTVGLKLMRLQKGLAGAGDTPPVLNIAPTFLLVPAALEVQAKQVLVALVPNQVSNANPFSGALQLIVESRLDSATNGATAWYLVASPAQFAGAEVAFLNGQQEPSMIRVEGQNILGLEWGVFLDCGVKFLEHRAWYRCRGA